MTPPEQSIRLGTTVIEICPIGVGTWSWGDREGWGEYDEPELYEAFVALVNAGVNFYDTAEVYGNGASEQLLGRFVQRSGSKVSVATKFAPLRTRLLGWAMRSALDASLGRLRRERVELYQLHWQTRWVSIERWMKALARAQQTGKAVAVGVSNYSVDQMSRARDALARCGVPLTSNQVEYSLLCRKPETSGLLDACKNQAITMIAYSPLAMGLLTGKYSGSNMPGGTHRTKYTAVYVEKIKPLVSLLQEIGHRRGGKTPAQIALNWVICKGALPIPGVKNKRQATEIIGALGWRLTQDEIGALDALSSSLMKP